MYVLGCITIGVPHLLFSFFHVSKVVHDGLREVFQAPELNLKRLQFLHLGNLEGQKKMIRGKWQRRLYNSLRRRVIK